MVSLLTLTSLQLHSRLTNIPYFSSLFYWDPLMQFKVQKRFSNRIPFYLSNILTILFLFVPCLIMIFSFISEPSILSVIVVVCNLTYLGFVNLYLYFNVMFIFNCNEYSNYISLIFKTTSPLFKNLPNKVPVLVSQFFRLWKNENIKMLLQNDNVDYVGMMIASNVFYCILLILVFPFTIIFLNLDPLFHVIEWYIYSPNETERFSPVDICLIFFRFFVFALINFDMNRTNAMLGNILIAQFPIYKSLVLQVKEMTLRDGKLSKFNQIRLILSMGLLYNNSIITVLLAVSFMIIVFSNCFVVIGFETLSPDIYLLGAPACIISHALIGSLLHTAAQIHETSYHMINSEWRYELVDMVKKRKIFSMKYYKRLFKMTKPVTFRSGDFAAIVRTTILSYYSYIMVHTVNIFLLFIQVKR